MKKVTLIVGLLIASNFLMGQEKRDRPREVQIEKHKERLNLSESQEEELKTLRESLKPELEALRKDQSKSRSEKMRAHADIVEKREKGLTGILTEEQLLEIEAIKEEMKAKRGERRKGRKHRDS